MAGIIIDTFGDMKEEEEERLDDMHNICFICGDSKEDIQKFCDYTTHMFVDHNMWHYVWYIAYITQHKKKDEYDGIEQYVKQCLDANNYSWFPFH